MINTSPSSFETIIPCVSSVIQNLDANVKAMDDSLLCEFIDFAPISAFARLALSMIEKTSDFNFTLSVLCPHLNSDGLSLMKALSLLLKVTRGLSLFQARE